MKRGSLILIASLAALLVAAGVLQTGLPGRKSTGPGKRVHLAAAFPSAIDGAAARTLELGSTENVRAAVEKTLRYDDVLFREYKLKSGTVTVYVAYWGPGQMPTQLVASHTPDRCWVENGWTCEEMRHGVSAGVTETSFLPAEWRYFRAPDGQKLHVLFWHLVGSEVYDYGERANRMPSIWRWWRDAAQQAFRAPAEQYFIRVTSDIPFENLRADPGWDQLLRVLGMLGLESKVQGERR